MPEWLSKADLQRFVNSLPDNAVLCSTCVAVMKQYSDDEGNYYGCPTLWCPNEARIRPDEIERDELAHRCG